MTQNKMPEVGKLYLNTMIRRPYRQETRVVDFNDDWVYVKYNATAAIGKIRLEEFKEYWKEIPESNEGSSDKVKIALRDITSANSSK